MKVKLSLLIPVIIILSMALISYFFFLPKNSYREDCDKPLEGYDLLFVYAPACPHCKSDYEIIKKLNLSEKFYMVNGESSACQKIINYYSDYLIYHKNSNYPIGPAGLYTPTKVCLKDNKTYIGSMSEEKMLEFYRNCSGVEK